MKKSLILLLFVFTYFVACKKDESTSNPLSDIHNQLSGEEWTSDIILKYDINTKQMLGVDSAMVNKTTFLFNTNKTFVYKRDSNVVKGNYEIRQSGADRFVFLSFDGVNTDSIQIHSISGNLLIFTDYSMHKSIGGIPNYNLFHYVR
jgi:hypothetical protein